MMIGLSSSVPPSVPFLALPIPPSRAKSAASGVFEIKAIFNVASANAQDFSWGLVDQPFVQLGPHDFGILCDPLWPDGSRFYSRHSEQLQ